MTSEEKRVIENLKTEYEKLIKEDNILFPLYKSDAKILINLIEKQSKEIEELKEVKWYYEISRVPKDKIKAKIEEVSDGTYDAKIVLQSLIKEE